MASNGMTDAFRIYLESCSEDMVSQIMAALYQAGNRAVTNAAPNMLVSGSAVAKTEKKQRKKTKSDSETGGPKRPLNSWMAYRKYYNRVLEGHTQKAISKCLTQLWKAELFKAKWAILARAYSTVRGGVEKKCAPLDPFFELCAPLIGVIQPDQYLETMGWAVLPPLIGDLEKVPQLMRTHEPTLDSFHEEYTTTNYGVDELVQYCYRNGYSHPSNSVWQSASTHGSVTMASRPTNAMIDDITALDESLFNGSMDQANSQMLVAAPPLPTVHYDPSSFTLPPAAAQETLDEAVGTLEDTCSQFPHVEAELFENFNPGASNDDGWDAHDLNALGFATVTAEELIGDLDWSQYLTEE